MKHFVYIVKCKDSSLYTGYTLNVEKRVNEHNTSRLGAKSLKGKLPVKLVYHEEYKSKTKALRREYQIKMLTRAKKLELVGKMRQP
jgi:putative endonuclease